MKKIILIFAGAFAFSFFSCNNSSSDTPVPPIVPKVSDWLFLFYADADSNLNDSIYRNLRQVEAGLAYARNPDGSAAPGYPSINVVVLWDGISEKLKGPSKFMHPDGAVFELGADYDLKAQWDNKQFELGDVWKLSPNTKDLTESVRDWLKKEPDMRDYKTLQSFLTWANLRYRAQNVVVNINDHGGGTHKEAYTDSTAVSKSVCSDETATAVDGKGTWLLTCKNVKDALAAAGYVGANKPKILWNDLCLQATAEVVYNYAGCAEYLSASPNSSVSNDLLSILGNLKSSCTALDLGKLIASVYYNTFKDMVMPHFPDAIQTKENRASGGSMFTWSLISLDQQKVSDLKNAVENFADALLEIKKSDQDAFNSVYTSCIKQDLEDLSNCKGLAYGGTFAYLNDLGQLAKGVEEYAEANSQTQLKGSAAALKDLLKHGDDKLIVYAWGGKRATADTNTEWTDKTTNQMYLTGQMDFLSKNNVNVENSDDIYGMTIVTSRRYCYDGSQFVLYPAELTAVKNYYDWTEFSEKWGQVINAWMEASL